MRRSAFKVQRPPGMRPPRAAKQIGPEYTIMKLPSTQERRTWLDDIERRRGQPARLALQTLIGALWPSR